MKLLNGKLIIVTGGSGLLGRAMIKDITEKGAEVINLDIAEAEGLDCQTIICDITNDEELEEVVSSLISKYDKLDGLVNNAYPRTKDWGEPFETMKIDSWRKNVDMQLNSIAFLIQKLIPMLRGSSSPSIVNIASIYGVVGNDFKIYENTSINPPAAYSAIKGGLINFTRFLSSLYGREQIRVNCVSPGGIFDHQPKTFVDNYEQKVPMGRMGKPEDIASPVSFLLSSEAAYITGQNLIVDGGWTVI